MVMCEERRSSVSKRQRMTLSYNVKDCSHGVKAKANIGVFRH